MVSRAINPLLTMGRMMGRSARRVFRQGPIDSVRWGLFHLADAYYERRLRADTEASQEWGEEAYRHIEGGVHYLPLPYAVIRVIMRDLARRDRREIAHDVLSRLDLANASFMSEVGQPATPTHGIDLDVFLGSETGRRA